MSDGHDHEALEARLARLERVVEELARRLSERDAAPPAVAPERPERRAGAVGRESTAAFMERFRGGPATEGSEEERLSSVRWTGQFWLNRLGIGLLLLGVALLFRYSIDMGWLTPAVRVGFGLVVGVTLLAAGLRIGERRRFASVLVGGGIATFYITGFAAFILYGLIGYLAAFAGMVAVTALAFGLALRQGEPALGVLAALGGLGTPLILGLSYGSPRGFALYTCAILAWTVGLHLRRGWHSVLWTSLLGGWLLLLLYAYDLSEHLRGGVASDPWTLQEAAVFAWLLTGVLPIARRERARADAAPGYERRWRDWETLHWYGLALLPPLLALVVSGIVWRPATDVWGWWVLAGAAGYALVGWALYARDGRIARVLLLVSSVLASVGLVAALRGNVLLTALAAQALAMHGLARFGGGRAIRWAAHKVFIAAALWTAWRVAVWETGSTAWGPALADLAVLGAALASSFLFRGRAVLGYRWFAHFALMAWLWRQLAPYGGGEGYATVAWGALGVGLLVYAMSRGWPVLERTALVTLGLVVAKLFLVDLAALDALYRVLLFLGFGSVFLFLSYWLQAWWKPTHASSRQDDGAAPREAAR